jgi:hypothetical protein
VAVRQDAGSPNIPRAVIELNPFEERMPIQGGGPGSDPFSSFFACVSPTGSSNGSMPRHLRVQFSDAIFHLMARGNGRQAIVRDDEDRRRRQDCLAREAVRRAGRVYALVIMSNHLHVVLKTPEPNLARVWPRTSRVSAIFRSPRARPRLHHGTG